MSTLSLQTVVEQTRRLPSPPPVVAELLADFQDEDVGSETLARKIGKDQSLSAAVLRLANSSFYGMPGKVSSLRRAAVVLGTHSLRTLTVAAGVTGQFAALRCPGFDWHGFWQHAFAAAVCARALARQRGQDSDTAFAAALIHDIGRLALLSLFPKEYAPVLAECQASGADAFEVERRLLDLDHAAVGAALAKRWNLPRNVQAAIAHHHLPEIPPLDALTDVVYVADTLTRHPVAPAPRDALRGAGPVWKRLGLDVTDLETCIEEANAGALEMRALLLEAAG